MESESCSKSSDGDALGRRERDDLIVDEAEEVFDGLELPLDELDRTFQLGELREAALEDFDVGLLDAARAVVGRALDRALGLRELVLHGLPVDRAQVVLAAAVDVEEVDEVFPALVEAAGCSGGRSFAPVNFM